MADLSKLEGYEELVTQLFARMPPAQLGRVLAKVPAKARLAGLSVRERLAGLSADELEALRVELATPKEAKKPKRRVAKATR
jgi:hypothetical protein